MSQAAIRYNPRMSTPTKTPVVGIVMGVLLALVGTAGDLTESLIKRDLGVKDILQPNHAEFLKPKARKKGGNPALMLSIPADHPNVNVEHVMGKLGVSSDGEE